MAFTTRDGRTQTVLAEINMIPFIDIVLVLLIIFMITAPVIQSGIDVSVPKTEIVREISEERLTVTIDRAQKVYLQSAEVNVNELGAKIQEKLLDPTRQSVYVVCDEVVPYGIYVAVLDRLKQAGINNIAIVTQPLERTRR
jgi:biopolymer transport protein ExbD/biopolymer transport protein TolR